MRALDVGRRGKLVDTVCARVQAPDRAPDRAALARSIVPLEYEDGRLALLESFAAEFAQLRLELLLLLRVLTVRNPGR